MTKYQRAMQGIWMIQVRPKGSHTMWSVTGPNWFFLRSWAESARDKAAQENMRYEYRVVRYLPVTRGERS